MNTSTIKLPYTAPNTPPACGATAAAQACAACKHQRRRCSPNCPLAPYFPANKQKEFLNVHKLFGVSNVVKTLKTVKPNERRIAMASVIFEANMWCIDPVGGCCGLIRDLEERLRFYMLELDSVMQQIMYYRSLHRCDQDLVNVETGEQFLNGKVQENIKTEVEKDKCREVNNCSSTVEQKAGERN